MKIRLILLSLLGIAAYIALANFNSKMIKDNPVSEQHTRASVSQPHPATNNSAPEKAAEHLAIPQVQVAGTQQIVPKQTAAPLKLADQPPEATPPSDMPEPPVLQLSVQPQTGTTEKLQQLQTELGQKEQQIRQLLDAQEAVAAKSRSLMTLLDVGTADVAAKDKLLQAANDQIKALTADKNITTTELASTQSTIEQLNTALKKLESAGAHSEHFIKEKEMLLKTVQQQLQEKNTEADSLKAQLTDTVARLQTARADLEQTDLKATSLLRLGQEKEKLTTTLEQQKNALEMSLQEKTQALNEALHTIQSLQQEVAAQPQVVAAVQNMLDERNREFDQVKEETSAQIEQLSKQVADFSKKDKQVNAELNKCRAEANAAQKKITELESAQALTQASLTEAEKTLAATLSSKDTLQNQLNDKEAAISGTQAQLSALLAKTTALNDENIGLARQLEALQADQKNLQVIKTSFEEKSAALLGPETKLKDLAALQIKNAELTKSLEEKTSALANATKQGEELTTLQAQLAEQQAKNKELSAQSDANANTIKQLEAEKTSLAGQLTATQTETTAVEALKKSLTEKTNALLLAETKIKDLATADEQIAALQAKLKDTTVAQQALQTAKQTAEQKVIEAESTLKTLNQSLTASNGKEKTLAAELAAAQVRIKDLIDKNSLQQQQDLVPNLNQQIATLRNQVTQMATTEALAKKNLAESTAAMQARTEVTQTADKKMQALQAEKDALQKQLDQLKITAQPTTQQSSGNSANSNLQDRERDCIADSIDLCPDSPAGIPVNALGCPEKKGIILEGVNFKSNTAILLPDALKNLDRVAASLVQLHQVKGEIAGYTDSVGDPKRNQELSTLRAQAVVKYLAEKGVAMERLTAKGYGQEKPIANNTTSAGKQKNRRIELYPLAQ